MKATTQTLTFSERDAEQQKLVKAVFVAHAAGLGDYSLIEAFLAGMMQVSDARIRVNATYPHPKKAPKPKKAAPRERAVRHVVDVLAVLPGEAEERTKKTSKGTRKR